MDEKDRYILARLKENARVTTATLGRALGVSRVTIQNRINKLVAQGVIARFTIEEGDQARSSLVEALVLLKTNAVDTRSLITRIRKFPGILSFTSLNGQYDFALEVRACSTAQLDETLAEVRRLDHVADTNCFIRLKSFP